ncbi:transposase [Hymenobacter lucidus]|uniref:Transposase n=1 Tax=Hymenobacter lucidus TaxID=2880930 RepID=A0ABS8AXZ7_9BACT|nr:transposase [Hymenobacter lucidus]MCB2410671.1 transposase [Hymenobacter lucidus]
MHQFTRAVFNSQNGQFRFVGKEEQQVADACKRLVQDVIVCWNCYYLNQQLCKLHLPSGWLADAIARMSPVSWQHIDLQGEFDISGLG